MMIEVNDTNSAEVLANELPVVLDLGATWCGPCKALAPIIDEVAEEYAGKAIFAKADVEEATELAARFRVRNVPTVLFIKGGEVKDKSVGLVAKQTIIDKLSALL
ncbi:MAG: thioredoxin domain-containing protein [Bacteroidales bacterium]|nr:thioredoxin domain-containing protein [Bacteroidales bacterium]